MFHKIFFTALFVSLASTLFAGERVIYVSPRGNDAFSGTVAEVSADGTDGPLKTPQAALEKVKEIRAFGMIGAQLLSRKQTLAYPGAVGTALEILPGFAGMVTALIVIFSRRFWLGVLVLLALGCAVALMALVQNRRPGRVAASVRLPGQIACAALAGLGANLAARSTITLGGYLACVLCAVISTRAAARLLTRR